MDVKIGDTYPNFETLCRLCLQPDTAKISVFPNDATSAAKGQLSIPIRIMACLALEVMTGDGLPPAICVECRYQLEKSYYFRKRSQLSDSKLKKHLRLLSLGKQSRIFCRTEEEDFEDELEFEDSLRFLNEKDAERQKIEQEKDECWRDWLKEVLREEIMREYKDEIRITCRNELRSEVEDMIRQELRQSVLEEVRSDLRPELRCEVRQEVKEELRQDVIEEVRESLKQDVRQACIQEAKVQLRDELRKECREEESLNILNDLTVFLNSKRNQIENKDVQQFDELLNGTTNMNDDIYIEEEEAVKKVAKAVQQRSETTIQKYQSHKFHYESETKSNNSANEITSTEQMIFVEVPSVQTNKNNSNNKKVNISLKSDDRTESAFYILDEQEADNPMEEETQIICYDDEMEFQLTTTSESSENDSTTYKIEENGELKFLKKKHSHETELMPADDDDFHHDADNDEVEKNIIFEPDNEQEEISEEMIRLEEDNKEQLPSLSEEVKPKVEAAIKKAITAPSGANVISDDVAAADVAKTLQCTECPRTFSRHASLARHMTMHGVLQKRGVSYECEECNIILSCKSALKRHMLKHTGRKPFVCEECGKSFIQREILRRHSMTHSGLRPYECPHCERSFSQKLNLTQHINKTHSENPKLQQHVCHICPKRFNHASGLSRHLATHSGVAFQCITCERTFTDRSSIRRHIMNVHDRSSTNKITTISLNAFQQMKNDENKEAEEDVTTNSNPLELECV